MKTDMIKPTTSDKPTEAIDHAAGVRWALAEFGQRVKGRQVPAGQAPAMETEPAWSQLVLALI